MSEEMTWRSFQRELNQARAQGVSIPFVRGPIPLEWLSRASKLGGKCLNVAVAIWYVSGMGWEPLRLPTSIRSKFGLSRHSTHYALKLMEKAGLVQVERKPGQAPRVIMLSIKSRKETP